MSGAASPRPGSSDPSSAAVTPTTTGMRPIRPRSAARCPTTAPRRLTGNPARCTCSEYRRRGRVFTPACEEYADGGQRDALTPAGAVPPPDAAVPAGATEAATGRAGFTPQPKDTITIMTNAHSAVSEE